MNAGRNSLTISTILIALVREVPITSTSASLFWIRYSWGSMAGLMHYISHEDNNWRDSTYSSKCSHHPLSRVANPACLLLFVARHCGKTKNRETISSSFTCISCNARGLAPENIPKGTSHRVGTISCRMASKRGKPKPKLTPKNA